MFLSGKEVFTLLTVYVVQGVDRGNTSTCNDWTEHKSSSGKKYYYNRFVIILTKSVSVNNYVFCSKTEVSQWEKPREWVEAEKSRQTQMVRHFLFWPKLVTKFTLNHHHTN